MEESSPNRLKTLWEKEKLLVTSNFSFSHSVFKRLVLQTRKNQGLFGKGLNDFERERQTERQRRLICSGPIVEIHLHTNWKKTGLWDYVLDPESLCNILFHKTGSCLQMQFPGKSRHFILLQSRKTRKIYGHQNLTDISNSLCQL